MSRKIPALKKGEMSTWMARSKHGKCVAKGALIPTDRGLVPIETFLPEGLGEDEFGELRIGIQTPDGMQYTSHFYNSGVKATRQIVTDAGFELTGPLAHPVLTLSAGGARDWKKMEEIQVGDYVAVQRHAGVFGRVTKLPEFQYEPKSRFVTNLARPDLPQFMSPDLAYVLGLLIGDGGLSPSNRTSICFTSADPELVDAVAIGRLRWG